MNLQVKQIQKYKQVNVSLEMKSALFMEYL